MLANISAYRKYRLLEMIPGALIWLTLLGGLLLTFIKPLSMVYVIIIFDFYWMIKMIYLSTFLVISYYRYRVVMRIDWQKRCLTIPASKQIYHLVMIPNSTESISVIKSTLTSLANTTFPKDRIIIAFAAEERYPNSIANGLTMQKIYQDVFQNFHIAIHPQNIPGELASKGANLNWAGRQVKQQIIDKENIPYENIIVSILDADTCVDCQYFSYLTWVYCHEPNRTQASYQPIPMFNNNIWDAPAIMRVAAMGTTFWLMQEQVRPERLFTFSSHSMSFVALVAVDWWETDAISDDSRIFLQCFLHYQGNYRVVPLHMPVYMDTVLADGWWKSLKNLYYQQRRWACGSENIPYMLWFFWNNHKIAWQKRLYHLFNQIEGMWSWGTTSLIIFIFGYLPLYLLNPIEHNTVIATNAPYIMKICLTIANIGLILAVILGTLLLPKRPQQYQSTKYITMLLQWALLPISMIIFGTLPAIEAQTRLFLGKYLGFYITEKTRK